MRRFLGFILLLIFLIGGRWAEAQTTALPKSNMRAAFVHRMARIEMRMSQQQVKAILGAPDATEGDSWLYGLTRPGGFASLGQVVFDARGTVRMIFGNGGKPPPEKVVSESDLRSLLDVLWQFSRDPGSTPNAFLFDPLLFIKTANRFQSEGKERALAAMEEFLRIRGDYRTGIAVLLLVLFDLDDPQKGFPSIAQHDSYPPEPLNKTNIPRFPIVIIDDIPLFLVYGGAPGDYIGDATPVFQLIEFVRQHGHIRATVLHPSTDPLSVVEKMEKSDQWLFGRKYPTKEKSFSLQFAPLSEDLQNGRQAIMQQLFRLVRSVGLQAVDYRHAYKKPFSRITLDEWASAGDELSKSPVCWDENIQDYKR